MRVRPIVFVLLAGLAAPLVAHAADGNRLTYLDSSDPYYVHRDFPRLVTPQWVGEEGVEAVVVLAIDDMTNNTPKYEAFLRPILGRLKKIDGRAAASIMTNRIDPNDPQLQQWLKEGLSIEVHTLNHPCPLLQKGDFAAAQRTYHDCVDLMNRIPGNRPVAFRMPCCDSLNTPSPRFFAEIFNDTSAEHHDLSIDSSVFNILTPDDPALPRALVQDADGSERFRKYLPFPSFVNTIENYPYPYVIGRLCWEFPCVVPSDWEANHLHRPNNPRTVEDLKAALDAIVIKQGVFNLVFHPHGWIKSEQVVELIDHAVAKHGKKVKFLTFREANARLEQNLLGGQSLRNSRGHDNGVRLVDVNGDGYLDVLLGNAHKQETRVWAPAGAHWDVSRFPTRIVEEDEAGRARDAGVRFLEHGAGGQVAFIQNSPERRGAWAWRMKQTEGSPPRWVETPALLQGLESDGKPLVTSSEGRDRGVRFRDIDGDGQSECLVGNEQQNAIYAYSTTGSRWQKLPFGLPEGARFVDETGKDAGLRFCDLDEDGRDDIIVSNDRGYAIDLYDAQAGSHQFGKGWNRRILAGRPGDARALPRIVRQGRNNGFWAHSRSLWWQNEDTARLPDLVDRRSFNDLLRDVEPRGKSPEASRRSLRVHPGFKVEIAACEPLVEDPIAFDWSADGRLWVVEMGDYPMGTDGKGRPGGVVRVLEDTNGDGRYDRSATFLDGLPFPTGLLPWRKGVLIGCAPDIFYAEDRDGDGKADFREVLFTGFNPGNQQHRLNGFELGLDGWVYGANGDSGGRVRSLKTGEVVSIQGRDFRFQPDTGRFEAASGQTQYGRHRDDFGHWFGNNNPNWAWHYVLAESDLKRNPGFAAPDPKQMLDTDRRLYPVSRTLARFNDYDNVNRVTSANSPTPYRDELFGPAFENSLFVSEPVHNLVHRVVLAPEGATFTGQRFVDEMTREFLASSDNWFRPTMLKTGPDGALWVADMYRAVIEHPEWIPDDWEARLDLRAGHEQGHIYRVYPVDRTPRSIPRLDRLDTAGLVAALESPSGWQRDTAMRLLLHSHDRAAIGPLKALAEQSQRPRTRVQAICTLGALGGLDEATVTTALNDAHPQVRRHAIRAGRALLTGQGSLGAAMARLADDPDAAVRFELALALGDWNDPLAAQALATVVRHDPEDRWLRAAVLSSALPHASGLLSALFTNGKADAVPSDYVEPLFTMVGSQPAQLAPLVDLVATPRQGKFAPWQFAAGVGLLDSAQRSGTPLQKLAQRDAVLRAALDKLPKLYAAARDTALDARSSEADRLAAFRLVGRAGGLDRAQQAALVNLIGPQTTTAIQAADIDALGRAGGPGLVSQVLAEHWKSSSPTVRSALLDALLSRNEGAALLLKDLEGGMVRPAEIDAAHRTRLLKHRDTQIRQRAEALFASGTAAREQVIASYRKALRLEGSPERGREVFKRVCAVCHRVGNVGTEVGADLAALTDKSPEAMLTAILDPNRAFEAKFTNFTVQTTDGRVLTGMIATETGNSVTLRRQEGKEDVLLRSDIEAMASTGQSLMPEGLEKDLSVQDVADLIALLGSTGAPRREQAGNQPETVAADASGKVTLRAAQAEIYGDSLTFEPKYGNLGIWSAPTDRAVWTFTTEKPGKYNVWFDWACAQPSQGNPYLLQIDETRIEGKVASTGTWDDYRQAQVGEVSLEAGRHRLELKPTARIRGALIDLRTIELRPAGENPAPCCDPQP